MASSVTLAAQCPGVRGGGVEAFGASKDSWWVLAGGKAVLDGQTSGD